MGRQLRLSGEPDGNGHANAVLGGTGNTSALSSDIYNERLRNSAWRIGSAQSGSGRPSMVYQNMRKANTNAYGFRIHNSIGAGANRGWSFSPRQDQVPIASRTKMYNSYNWGSGAYTAAGQVTNGLLAVFVNSSPDFKQNKYHQFPCSKCHMPHASRLPRLMLTNCLDVTHTTWSRRHAVLADSGDVHDQPLRRPAERAEPGRPWPETTASNNCHRVGAAFGRSGYMGNGWNRVTPW